MTSQYNISYFSKYLTKGRYTSIAAGDRWAQYAYWKRYLLKNLERNARVIEIGAGLLFFGKRMDSLFAYTALDVSFEALDHGRGVNGVLNAVQATAITLPIKNASHNALVAFDVVEHLQTPGRFFDEAWRILKPGGVLILTMPNPQSFGVLHKAKSDNLIPSMLRDDTHVSLLTGEEWFALIRHAGFGIVRSGTDALWDVPYFQGVPPWLQKAFFLPFSILVAYFLGSLKWTRGENLVVVAKK